MKDLQVIRSKYRLLNASRIENLRRLRTAADAEAPGYRDTAQLVRPTGISDCTIVSGLWGEFLSFSACAVRVGLQPAGESETVRGCPAIGSQPAVSISQRQDLRMPPTATPDHSGPQEETPSGTLQEWHAGTAVAFHFAADSLTRLPRPAPRQGFLLCRLLSLLEPGLFVGGYQQRSYGRWDRHQRRFVEDPWGPMVFRRSAANHRNRQERHQCPSYFFLKLGAAALGQSDSDCGSHLPSELPPGTCTWTRTIHRLFPFLSQSQSGQSPWILAAIVETAGVRMTTIRLFPYTARGTRDRALLPLAN
jgi:hypothetical protein